MGRCKIVQNGTTLKQILFRLPQVPKRKIQVPKPKVTVSSGLEIHSTPISKTVNVIKPYYLLPTIMVNQIGDWYFKWLNFSKRIRKAKKS